MSLNLSDHAVSLYFAGMAFIPMPDIERTLVKFKTGDTESIKKYVKELTDFLKRKYTVLFYYLHKTYEMFLFSLVHSNIGPSNTASGVKPTLVLVST